MTVKLVDNVTDEIRTIRNVSYFTINENENNYIIKQYDGKMLLIVYRTDYALLCVEPNT